MSDRPRVVVTRRLPDRVEQEARNRFDAILNPGDVPMDQAELARAVREADGLLCTVTDRITAEVIEQEELSAGMVANFGVGYDNIAVSAAARRGLVVSNTPGVLTDDTADLAIYLMLAAARRAGEGERLVRSGGWDGWRPTQLLGTRVTGKTLGIVGLGRIGRAVARRARFGFGMTILYHNRSPLDGVITEPLDAQSRSLEGLLQESDFVSLHVPASDETRGLINSDTLESMKPGSILVNTARGDIVDEDALADALEQGRLAAAGLDVHREEPRVNTRLAGMENVVLLPHLGSATLETREAMGLRALDNLSDFFAGRDPRDRIC